MVNVAVCGANGKMGQEVVKALEKVEDLALVAKIDVLNGEFVSIKDACETVKIDVLIDFTQPKSIYENALFCLNNGINIVIGTTGLCDDEIEVLKNLSEEKKIRMFNCTKFFYRCGFNDEICTNGC